MAEAVKSVLFAAQRRIPLYRPPYENTKMGFIRESELLLDAKFLGLDSIKDVKPFQKDSDANWLVGLPADSNEADAILIFGGDGTVHRHLPQLVKLRLPVLVVPCGSGNDFARALGLGSVRDSLAAWRLP